MTSPAAPVPPTLESIFFGFDNTYARLPGHFYARIAPTPVAAPRLIKLNVDLARYLNLDPEALASPQGVSILAGNSIAPGSEPLAQAYAGHQFGYFVNQLGDGRANLLGEVVARDGLRYDIQLKGSGRTPFSRGGDGRAALGPVLREYILSEAMFALGVPTTRALAAVATGERVFRETPLPGAVFTRVASSHLRVGTFQYFAARQDTEALHTLAGYAIARHYPEAAQSPHPYLTLLETVVSRHARLVAQWMLLGFIHGVMNTDNTSISGETIDYGPCAFMEAYRADMVFSSIDHSGRYAYSNQPHAALWNLARLAEALLPILAEEAGSEEAALASARAALEAFDPQFQQARITGLLRKIGIAHPREGDAALAEDLLARMSANKADFTLTFRRLGEAAATPGADVSGDTEGSVSALFADPTSCHDWTAKWRARLGQEPESEPESPRARAAAMRALNPLFIPRNHLVEVAIDAAIQREDFEPFEQLLDTVIRPFEDRAGFEKYSAPARPEECVLETFCGT